jgi:hypothetical protein
MQSRSGIAKRIVTTSLLHLTDQKRTVDDVKCGRENETRKKRFRIARGKMGTLRALLRRALEASVAATTTEEVLSVFPS